MHKIHIVPVRTTTPGMAGPVPCTRFELMFGDDDTLRFVVLSLTAGDLMTLEGECKRAFDAYLLMRDIDALNLRERGPSNKTMSHLEDLYEQGLESDAHRDPNL